MMEGHLSEIVGGVAAIVVAIMSVGVAYLKKQVNNVEEHINHRSKPGKGENLYDLARKNDIVQAQMFELVKSVKKSVESTGVQVDRLKRAHITNRREFLSFKTEMKNRLEKLEDK